MSKDCLTGLVMATMLEAEPLIRELSLQEYEAGPFQIFGNDHIHLIITGIGKANAAMACTYFIEKYHPLCICNLGAAGATDMRCRLGECYHISSIVEPDRPCLKTGLPHIHNLDTLDGFPLASLATQDRPVRDTGERSIISGLAQLVDMEGASVAQTCSRFHTKCYMFKFISDTPENVETGEIPKNIVLYRDAFIDSFSKKILGRLV